MSLVACRCTFPRALAIHTVPLRRASAFEETGLYQTGSTRKRARVGQFDVVPERELVVKDHAEELVGAVRLDDNMVKYAGDRQWSR